jgi:hypothetical protein
MSRLAISLAGCIQPSSLQLTSVIDNPAEILRNLLEGYTGQL